MDLADKPNDLSFYCVVQLLSSSDVFYRFVELLEPIISFLIEKRKTFKTLDDKNFLQDLLFLTDLMQHLQSLILSPKEKEKYISDLAQTIFSFQKKLTFFRETLFLKSLIIFLK